LYLIDALLTRHLRAFNARHMQLEPIDGVHVQPVAGKQYLLYIHIPFCESLCPFCSFHRVRFVHEKTERYFRALRKEINNYLDAGFEFRDVYVGGGTPTVMPDELATTLDMINTRCKLSSVSVETNPNHLIQATLDILKDAGVTRLSVGVQSLDNRLLADMRRLEPYGSAEQIMENLERTQGQFDTFNVDMIFNIPHQSRDSLINDLEQLIRLDIDQISYYPLMPSDDTQRSIDKHMGHLDFRNEKAMYELIRERLSEYYRPSSAWCFSKSSSSIDEYIVDHDEYLGVGSGSFSYLNGGSYSTSFSIDHYIDLTNRGKSAITAGREMTKHEQMQYDLLMKLFGLRINNSDIRMTHGPSFHRKLWKELTAFKLLGALKETQDELLLTDKGMYYWVIMMREFFIGVNNFRSQMRTQIHDEWKTLEKVSTP
jgi:menaquinone C8-methyltransferase